MRAPRASGSTSPASSIFVIDDDVELRDMTAGALRSAGYDVQTSASGCEAFDTLTHAAPALIVVGLVQEPNTSGVRALQRRIPALKEVPVLALCETAALEADAFLPAPFGAHDLLRAVKLFLALAADKPLEARSDVVDVGAVLEIALHLASRELNERAHVTREFDGQLRVRANPEQLCLIFLNLLLNAARAIEAGGARANGVRVAGWRTAEGRTVIEISDTGKGIAPERLAHVFEASVHEAPPSRLDINLASSQRILNAGGGSLTVTSKPGGGASFRVELATAQ